MSQPTILEYHFTKKTTKCDESESRMAAKVFKPLYKEGDEFWNYNDIGFLSGSAGYLLIREGRAVAGFVTMRS